MKSLRLLCIGMLAALASGCAHQVSFEDIAYGIEGEKQDESLIVVIDSATQAQRVPIRSFMTGIAHSWEAEPGAMLKDVADVEFPQMFSSYRTVSAYQEPPPGGLTLALTVPSYSFENFHATVTVHAIAYGPDRSVVLDESYTESGPTQGAKMFWAGAFGMKSAIRQSSFEAYKTIFESLRADLSTAVTEQIPATAPGPRTP